ncbi:predicted protein [Postia placenta Mad-698-R]|nr:predicted protein [Postia placenta Mad-698-R]
MEDELYSIFEDHPQSHTNDNGEPVIPGDALVDVLRAFSSNHDSVELMTREEETQMINLIESNPGLAVTPQVLLQFIAMRTTLSPHQSPEGSPPPDNFDLDHRGRSEERDWDEDHSRSSSRDSTGTSVWRPSSRGPPVPPKTPTNHDSPFDTSRRQRSTPLSNAAPSSWSRRPPPSRRKSTSRSRASSDSESTGPPTAYGRTSGRKRAPSNPSAPSSPISSPNMGNISRPHSRAQSQPQGYFQSMDSFSGDFSRSFSPEHEIDYRGQARSNGGLMSPPPSDLDSSFDDDQHFEQSVNSLPMPRASRSGSDPSSDSEDDTMTGLVMDRSAASSTVSLDVLERVDALQRINTDLGRKLLEAERTLQNRLADHEQELEDMQGRLEEVRSELSATKREEKELRAKERTNQNQISALESEIAMLQKSLDTARASYTSLQKQYQEQCDRDALAIRVANETLKKWHKGLKLPIEPIVGGVSVDAIEDWKALKEELGVECSAIDRIVEESAKTGLPRTPKEGEHPRRRRSRFYNIYNTYFYGDPEGGSYMPTSQFLFCIGASAAVAFVVGQAMAPQYVVPGGATYYDRAAWSSFNSIQASGEGFGSDGAAVWSFLGKLGGGAARTLRGWPT